MKKYKIEFQSFSDVITNSSSTVFLVDNNTYDELTKMVPSSCIYGHELTWDSICPEIFNCEKPELLDKEQVENIYHIICNINSSIDAVVEVSLRHANELIIKDREWLDTIPTYGLSEYDVKKYYEFCQDNKKFLEDNFVGKVYVDIEDCFGDVEDVYDYARNNSIWWESHH